MRGKEKADVVCMRLRYSLTITGTSLSQCPIYTYRFFCNFSKLTRIFFKRIFKLQQRV
jgi:hypothetical protein